MYYGRRLYARLYVIIDYIKLNCGQTYNKLSFPLKLWKIPTQTAMMDEITQANATAANLLTNFTPIKTIVPVYNKQINYLLVY